MLGFRVTGFQHSISKYEQGFSEPDFSKKVTKTIKIASNFMIFSKKKPKIGIFLRSKFKNFVLGVIHRASSQATYVNVAGMSGAGGEATIELKKKLENISGNLARCEENCCI